MNTILYTKEIEESKKITKASLIKEDPETEEEFDSIIKKNTIGSEKDENSGRNDSGTSNRNNK